VIPDGSDDPPVGKNTTCWFEVYADPGATKVLEAVVAVNANAEALPAGNIPPNVPLVTALQNPTYCTVVDAGTFSEYGPPDRLMAPPDGEANVTATRA
jgi:hypothetical protein